jgi:hypothetical protein
MNRKVISLVRGRVHITITEGKVNYLLVSLFEHANTIDVKLESRKV